jgi:hypothetical protein
MVSKESPAVRIPLGPLSWYHGGMDTYSGYEVTKESPQKEILCPRCHGEGWEPFNGTGVTCILCRGTKYVLEDTKDFEGI